MANVSDTLNEVMEIEGALACALVDWSSGLTLGSKGTALDIEIAAAGNTNVVRAKAKVMKELKIAGGIEDMLITLESQYHLIRLLADHPNLFLYIALDRSRSNLGMARHKLADLESKIEVK